MAALTNLVLALHDRDIRLSELVVLLGVCPKTVDNKLHGRTDFTFKEAMKIYGMIRARDDAAGYEPPDFASLFET